MTSDWEVNRIIKTFYLVVFVSNLRFELCGFIETQKMFCGFVMFLCSFSGPDGAKRTSKSSWTQNHPARKIL